MQSLRHRYVESQKVVLELKYSLAKKIINNKMLKYGLWVVRTCLDLASTGLVTRGRFHCGAQTPFLEGHLKTCQLHTF